MLNNRIVGSAGLIGGGLSILGAVAYLFKVASDPTELIGLYEAAMTHSDPSGAVAKLAGASIAVVGAFTVSLVAAYVGKPGKSFTG
ncbi:MAG TPA: hypothetical protein VHR97_00155 [Candidatus Baltobacteraceae bacterium]|jgi:hypothetical protein|nr:hypothetical protein [Candidatus Baltobacteraceae bacterium]